MFPAAWNELQKGYDDLQSIVPTCQQQSEFAVGAQKISKATVLQKSEKRFILPCNPVSSQQAPTCVVI